MARRPLIPVELRPKLDDIMRKEIDKMTKQFTNTIIIDKDYFLKVCGTRYDRDCEKLQESDKDFIFEMLMQKSGLKNSIGRFIDDYIDDVIDLGDLDDYRQEMLEGKREDDAYEKHRQKQIDGEA